MSNCFSPALVPFFPEPRYLVLRFYGSRLLDVCACAGQRLISMARHAPVVQTVITLSRAYRSQSQSDHTRFARSLFLNPENTLDSLTVACFSAYYCVQTVCLFLFAFVSFIFSLQFAVSQSVVQFVTRITLRPLLLLLLLLLFYPRYLFPREV